MKDLSSKKQENIDKEMFLSVLNKVLPNEQEEQQVNTSQHTHTDELNNSWKK